MRAIHAVFVGISVLAFASGASAKSLRLAGGPAEIPPASYKASQYVDSKGCVFIRAGYGGKVTWVPRVSRNRQVICGQTPSRVAGATPPPSTSQPQVTPRTRTVIAPPASAPTTPVRRAAAAPTLDLASWFFAPATSRANANPAPAATVYTALAPVSRPTTVTSPIVVSRNSNSLAIRNRPQAVHPGDYVRGRAIDGRTPAVTVTRTAAVVPAGYRTLLTEDQLVARRGGGTPQGQAQMDLIWTQTMPRRLIDTRTGRDMTAALPQVRYPYTSAVSTRNYAPSAPAGYTPIRKKTPTRDEASPTNMEKAALEAERLRLAALKAENLKLAGLAADLRDVEDVAAVTTDPVTPLAETIAPATFPYIQVATFGVPANASRTLARFQAAGLPTQSRPMRSRGRVLDIVLLGPFADDASLRAALGQARAAGFSDAFPVR